APGPPAVLPAPNVLDTPQNRAVLDVFGRYKPALEARDAGAILPLTTPDYADPGDPARGLSPTDHQGLEQRLKGDLSKVTGVRLEATVKDMEASGEQARLDYFQVLMVGGADAARQIGRAHV